MRDSADFILGKEVYLDTWEPIVCDAIEWMVQDDCLCCGERLAVLIELFDTEDVERRVRVGHCGGCGYVGYIDKPTRAWTVDFYHTRWDQTLKKTFEEIRPINLSTIPEHVRRAEVPPHARVFDTGAGYGQLLRQLREFGWDNLCGVELSPHRAELASRYADADVLHVSFEPAHIDEIVARLGVLDCIITCSVIEHMHDPRQFFVSCRDLQREGGVMVVSVPHVDAEVASNIALFLPHLHAFSATSLAQLAVRHSYQPLYIERRGNMVEMVARKVAQPSLSVYECADFRSTLARMHDEFDCRDMREGAAYVYWASTKGNRLHGLFAIPHDGSRVPLSSHVYRLIERMPASARPSLRRRFLGVHPRASLFEVVGGRCSGDEALRIGMHPLRMYIK